MPLDLVRFSDKLCRYMDQFEATADELARDTGIPEQRVSDLRQGNSEPTGDEILIFADFFKCDYRFFISNERLASFEQTEQLFRKHGNVLTKEDRWAIQEFLFLCECEEFLLTELGVARSHFTFTKRGSYGKGHGKDAAAALRKHFGYAANEVPGNVFKDFARIGFHVFRRDLKFSGISGLCIRHPSAGQCLLVNSGEDRFRQRFSAAHEAAHAILDDDSDFVVSFVKWDKKDLSEIRANTFASAYLLPPESLAALPEPRSWSPEKVQDWAAKMMVNVQTLIYGLSENNLIEEKTKGDLLGNTRPVPQAAKRDPEIGESLSPKSQERLSVLASRGLSRRYASLCFEAYERGIVSAGRLGEMLLAADGELVEIADLFGKSLRHDD